MLISLSLHLILLMFELLACDQLTTKRHLWVLVFIPLIFGSVASVGACVWSVKHDRSYELELFLAVNALQFVFLPLKLDAFVSWTWEVVFVPLWIVLCLSLVGKWMTTALGLTYSTRHGRQSITIHCILYSFWCFFIPQASSTAWYFAQYYWEPPRCLSHSVDRPSIQLLEIHWLLFRFWCIRWELGHPSAGAVRNWRNCCLRFPFPALLNTGSSCGQTGWWFEAASIYININTVIHGALCIGFAELQFKRRQ